MSRFLSLALATTLPLAAQTTSIIDRANQGSPTTPTPPHASEQAPITPGADTDAGIQRVAEPRRIPFRFSASFDQQLYVASNVFLTPDDNPGNDTGALVSTTTLSVGLDTLPVVVGEGRLVFSVGFGWQRNLHGLATSDQAIEDLDFDSYFLPVTASYRWGRGWEARASVTFGSIYSIKDAPSHELIYRGLTPALSLRKISRLSGHLVSAAGASISVSDTWASRHDVPPVFSYRDDRNDRVDLSLDAALYAVDGPWTLSPSIRLVRSHYLHWQEGGFNSQDRDDLVASAGLVVSYSFADWGAARAFATYDLRESSGGIVDYDYGAGSAGFGLSLGIRF
jgi:hypothetical protein